MVFGVYVLHALLGFQCVKQGQGKGLHELCQSVLIADKYMMTEPAHIFLLMTQHNKCVLSTSQGIVNGHHDVST